MRKLLHLLSRATGVLIIVLSFLTIVALLSYNANDPSLNHAVDAKPSNILGYYGAYVADFFLSYFGYASFLLPIIVSALGTRIAYGKKITWLLLRISLTLISLAMFALLLAYLDKEDLALVSKGGYIGSFLRHELSFYPSLAVKISVLTVSLFICTYFSLSLPLSEWKVVCSKTKQFLASVTNKLIVFKNTVMAILAWVTHKFSKVEKETLEQHGFKAPEKDIPNKQTAEEPAINTQKSSAKKANRKPTILKRGGFSMPSSDLLMPAPQADTYKKIDKSMLEQKAQELSKVLRDFGVKGEIIKINEGPVVTLYEFEPSAGTKSSRVIGLADDIARSMSATSARISVIPGKNALGIELPNTTRETVYLRELLEAGDYTNTKNKLPLVLGKDIAGGPVVADLARMPHLLVAGTTGSGKSVGINAMILSLLYHYTPQECKFVMIDPKMLELSVYDGIPNLLAPVVTEPKKAVSALKWVVKEMERRYKAMSTIGVRNLDSYNKVVSEVEKKGQPLQKQVQVGFDTETGEPLYETLTIDTEFMPYIVVIVDEMADLMLVAGKEIEALIQRLAQMARAAGIHLITATQRPSVDVITGVIKANFPTRISFQVTSKIDSRTVLGEQGAEQLLGMGDMLYMGGGGRIERVHGPFVDDKEVEKVVAHLKRQGEPDYKEEITLDTDEEDGSIYSEGNGDLYSQAVAIVLRDKRASTSYLQRALKIGYNRAANLIEQMEKEGVVSPPNHVGKREILQQS